MRRNLPDYLERGRSLNLSPLTLRTIRYNVAGFLDWLSRYRIDSADQLRRNHLSAWLTHLLGHRTTRGLPLKPRSINKKVECVRGFLVFLADEGLAHKSLAVSLEYVKEPRLLPKSVMAHEQVRKLLDHVATDTVAGFRDRTMFELLYSTGMRAGELLMLDIGDLDFQNATALVCGKGRKERMVPIGRTALHFLESYLAGIRPLLARNPAEPSLFLNDRGNRFPYFTLRKLVRAYANAADIPVHVTVHTFRRSCTTELIRAGANMYHVKDLLGHESLDTLKHYARLTITDLRETHRKYHPRERGDE